MRLTRHVRYVAKIWNAYKILELNSVGLPAMSDA